MTRAIKTVGVCGAGGTMGAGIALVAARAGFKTISFDMSEGALEKAAKQSVDFLDKSVARGKLNGDKRDAIVAVMSRTTSIDGLRDCDLVIEAVFEDLSIKRDLLERLDGACELLASGGLVAGDDDRAVGHVGESERVGRRQQRRGVDDDEAIRRDELGHQVGHGGGTEQLARVRRHDARREVTARATLESLMAAFPDT